MIGKALAHYQVLSALGKGGMGEVYRALDSTLGREVALKVLPPEASNDPERRRRFEREARTIASLKHPNIVTIYSFEEADGVHFLTMELVEGATLSSVIPRGGMSLEQFLEYGIAMADGMSSAHTQGITHRDLKPANVMLDRDGRVKVLDFGLAKLVHPDTEPNSETVVMDSKTAESVVLGTVAYMSPEQAQGNELDHRSDIFSSGALFYEMLTGENPFAGENKISTMSSILRDEPTPVHEVKAALPRHLARIVKRCLAKDPTRRYQSALDLRNDLEELKSEVDSGEIFATGESLAFGAPTSKRPKWLVPVVATAAVAAIAAVILWSQRSATPPPTTTRPGAVLEMTPITSDGRSNEATISTDGRYVAYVFLREKPDGSGVLAEIQQNYMSTHIWEVPFPRGEPVRVTTDLNSYYGVQITADGSTLVTDRSLEVNNLWIVRDGTPLQITSVHQGSGASDPVVLPDGRFVYSSNQGGRWDVWTREADGSNPRRLTTEASNAMASPSPDGRQIVFVSDRAGGLDLWKMPSSGGAATRLTFDGLAIRPLWVGDEIIFEARGAQPGIMSLHRMPASGGEARPLTHVNSWRPSASLDGTRLMYHTFDDERGHNQIEIMDLATGDVQHRIYLRQWEEATWSPDGTAVHYSNHVDGQDNVWSHPISAGDDISGDVQVTDFDDRLDIFWIAWSPDESTLALSRGKTYQDVVLLKGLR